LFMIAGRIVLRGIVRGGVVVPEKALDLPEGAQVEITVAAPYPDSEEAPAELAAEMAAWSGPGTRPGR